MVQMSVYGSAAPLLCVDFICGCSFGKTLKCILQLSIRVCDIGRGAVKEVGFRAQKVGKVASKW